MRIIDVVAVAVALSSGPLVAQEKPKSVPSDSARVSVPGCTKGFIFTAGPRTQDEPGSLAVPDGMHLRMNGPRKMMAEIKAHEGSMVEITGLMKKGQYVPAGIPLGGGVRIAPGSPSGASGAPGNAGANQIMIDVEAWRTIVGNCPTR